jgi:arylsulfatase A-like enzyme
VDLFPTLIELCQLEPVPGLAGRSLQQMIRNPDAPGKQSAYSTHPGGRGFRGHSLRSDRYRLVRWLNSKGEVGLVELYDHASDPQENVNVAAEQPQVVARLTKLLQAKMDEVVSSSHGP